MPSASDIRAGGAFLELYSKNGPLYAGLKAAQRRVQAFSSNLNAWGRKLGTIGAVITGPLVAASKHFAAAGDQLNKMSARTGVAVEALSELGFAAEQGGANLEMVENGMKRMQRSIVDAGRGLSTPIEGLKMVGLTVEQLQGLNPEQQFQKIADGITQIKDPTSKAAAAMMLLGKSGAKLLPMLDGLGDVRQQARDLGLVVSTEDAKRAAVFTDQMNILRRVLLDGVFSAGSAVAGVMGDMIMQIVGVAKRAADWIDANRTLFVTLLKIGGIIAAAGAGLLALGAAASAAATLLGILAGAVAFLMSPVGLAIAAVAGLATWALYATDSFGTLAAGFREVWGGISDALAGGDLKLAAEVAWAGMKLAWASGMEWIRQQWAELRFFLVDMWGQAAFGVLDVLNELWSMMVDGFWDAAGVIVDAWKWAEKTIAKSIGWIIAKRQGLNPEDVIANLEQDYARQQQGRDAGRAGRSAELAAAAEARRQGIDAARQEWRIGAEAKRDSAIAGASQELDEAKQKWAEAREAARQSRIAAEEAGRAGPEMPGLPGVGAAVDQGSQFASGGALGGMEAYKILMGTRDPALEVQKKQLSTLAQIERNTQTKPVVKEAVPPKR